MPCAAQGSRPRSPMAPWPDSEAPAASTLRIDPSLVPRQPLLIQPIQEALRPLGSRTGIAGPHPKAVTYAVVDVYLGVHPGPPKSHIKLREPLGNRWLIVRPAQQERWRRLRRYFQLPRNCRIQQRLEVRPRTHTLSRIGGIRCTVVKARGSQSSQLAACRKTQDSYVLWIKPPLRGSAAHDANGTLKIG